MEGEQLAAQVASVAWNSFYEEMKNVARVSCSRTIQNCGFTCWRFLPQPPRLIVVELTVDHNRWRADQQQVEQVDQ